MAPVAIVPSPSETNSIMSSKAATTTSLPTPTTNNLNGHASDSTPPSPPPLPRTSAAPKRINSALLPKRSPEDVSVLDSMEEALEAFGRGEFLVVVDDEGRENEGDLIIAASECSTEKMAWMIRYTR